MPPQVIAQLERIVMQMLQLVAAQVQSCQPWFTPENGAYRAVIAAPASSGGFREIEMNEELRGTGLRVPWQE